MMTAPCAVSATTRCDVLLSGRSVSDGSVKDSLTRVGSVGEGRLQASYILHYTPYRDTAFIVDLFSLEQGRLGLVARGARSARPGVRALYQPFRPLLVSWMGGGELRTLVGIEESGPALPLEGAALACGYYLNELILRLLGKEQGQAELFGHYAIALSRLGEGDDLESVLRTFELQILETIGVLPDLAHCLPNGEPIQAAHRYRYYPANAIAKRVDSAADSVAESASSRFPDADAHTDRAHADRAHTDRAHTDRARFDGVHADGVTIDDGVEIDGQVLLDMAALDFSDKRTRDGAKSLQRRLIAEQLGGRPLRSRSLFAAMAPKRKEADP